jgi:membrane protein implicated in regulation of membrane protease activity
VRLRALPLLLVLTGGDYALWTWSIAGGHDVLSLVAGLTLLPLAAVSLALMAVAGARLLAFALERPSAQGGDARRRGGHRRPGRRHSRRGRVGVRRARQEAQVRIGAAAPAQPSSPAPPAEPVERERSRRLAA